jgi:hypothetical protein
MAIILKYSQANFNRRLEKRDDDSCSRKETENAHKKVAEEIERHARAEGEVLIDSRSDGSFQR